MVQEIQCEEDYWWEGLQVGWVFIFDGVLENFQFGFWRVFSLDFIFGLVLDVCVVDLVLEVRKVNCILFDVYQLYLSFGIFQLEFLVFGVFGKFSSFFIVEVKVMILLKVMMFLRYFLEFFGKFLSIK